MQTIFAQSDTKKKQRKKIRQQGGHGYTPKFSSLVLLGSFLLQSWDRLEKVPCFNEHAMVLQGFKKRFWITDVCLFQSRFGCQESLPQVQNLVQEESNARHFLDSNVVRPSCRGHRVNPLPPLHSGSFFAAKRQSETCDSINFSLTKAPGYQLLYSDTWHSSGR